MDFMFDADTYAMTVDSDKKSGTPSLPIPSVPLKISDLDLSKKISKLSILQTLNKGFNSGKNEANSSQSSAKTYKYAKDTLDMLSGSATAVSLPSSEQPEEDLDAKILGNRLSRVLNQNNYDSSLRRSLELLEAQIKDPSRLTSPGIKGSNQRRKLRGDVEEDILKKQFLQLRTFQPVAEKLKNLGNDLDVLNECYSGITAKMGSVMDSSESVRSALQEKTKQRDMVSVKKHLLSSFKANFTLNQYEDHYLRNEAISEEYFRILDRVAKIYANCDVLLGTTNDNLGVAIMGRMSSIMDLATDKMASYLRKNLNLSYQEDPVNKDADTVANLQRALVYIRKNSVEKFNGVVSNLIESRSRALSDEFTNQLKGYSDEVRSEMTQKRLFMSSYDTKRFVSNILAYVHSVIVNELELAESLFSFDRREASEDLGLVIKSVSNQVVNSLSRPLRAAVESSLRQESKPAVIADLYDLLGLYCMLYGKLIDSDKSELISSLTQLQEEVRSVLFGLVKAKLKELKVASESEEIDEDFLGLPDWLVDFYSLFFVVFDRDHVNGETNGIFSMDQSQLDKLSSMLVVEPLQLLETRVKKLDFSKRSKLIFKINCTDFVQSKIEVVPLLADKAKEVSALLTAQVDELCDQAFDGLLQNSGLFDIYNLVNMIFALEDDFFEVSIYEPITENKLFNTETFTAANTKLGEFLTTYITSTDLNNLISPSINTRVSTEPSLKFVKFYSRLTQIVAEYLRDDNGDSVAVFQWDTQNIATLLGVELPKELLTEPDEPSLELPQQ